MPMAVYGATENAGALNLAWTSIAPIATEAVTPIAATLAQTRRRRTVGHRLRIRAGVSLGRR